MNETSQLHNLTISEREKLLKLAESFRLKKKREGLPEIRRVERGGKLPLSYAQQRLWFVAQMEGASEAYHISVSFQLKGDLDGAVLRRVLNRIVARHETLRTTFVTVDGETMQRIGPQEGCVFDLLEQDLEASGETECERAEEQLRRIGEEEVRRGFDLEKGPLVRGRLVRVGKQEHALLITMHHIVSDGWSTGVLLKEMSELYRAYARGEEDPLAELRVQYVDYAVWQRKWMEEKILRQQGEYWKRELEGAPGLLELPWDGVRPASTDYAGGSIKVAVGRELSGRLKELGRKHKTTLFMTLLGGCGALLGRLSGQKEVVIGTPVAGRGWSDLEALIGFFVNMLSMRVDLSGSPDVVELLERVKRKALGGHENQDIPFEQVVEMVRPMRSLSHSPVFQVTFAWQNAPEGNLELPGVEVKPLASVPVTAKYDLSLSLWEGSRGIEGRIDYAKALFRRETVERYGKYLTRMLEGMVSREREKVERLPLLGEREDRQIVEEWNRTEAAFPNGKCIHELFEEQVERRPAAVAVVYEDRELSYGELNSAANRIAHYLRRLGVKPDTRVAICLDRGSEMVAALLGVLKAGGAYVPLDPAYPDERLRYMLQDSAPIALLIQNHLKERFGELSSTLPTLDLMDASLWSDQPATNLENHNSGLTHAHVAYVIYTSGSTGQPKGVLVEHANVVRLFSSTNRWFHFNENDVWTLFHSYAFDFSVWEIWGALLYGGRLVVTPRDTARSADDFYRLICENKVTVLNQTPSAFRHLMAAQINNEEEHRLRYVIFGGEALEVAMLRPWYEKKQNSHTQLVNMYGITETTVHVTYRPLEARDTEVLGGSPIGCHIPDLRTYILDEQMGAVPVGVKGELYIGGAGVARGYLNRRELTAERFLPDRYAGEAGARMYKTGDIGRWLADGNIEFLGRNDGQIKIRGYRIELGEIEARILEYGGVREAVVVVREEGEGEKRLVAYYVGEGGEEEGGIGAEGLRRHLAGRLPEYMVPAAYVGMEAIPLTANGKLDRRNLPAPDEDAYAVRGYEEPRGEVERAVAEIWSEVLKVERVGRSDNFFALGGHSLIAVQVISRVQQRLAVKVGLKDLFLQPELGEFARVVASAGRADLPGIRRVEHGEDLPLSYAQQRLWFLHQLEPESSAYNITYALRLKGALDVRAVQNAITEIVRRHEVLRTTFAQSDTGPVQIVQPHTAVVMESDDISRLPAREREAAMRSKVQQEANRPFDLIRDPVLRVRIVQLGAEEHVLVIVMHHIVSDGWSEHILLREFRELCTAFSSGRPSPLPERELHYSDFAVWQRKWLREPLLAQQRDYWTTALRSMQSLKVPLDRREAAPTYAGGIARFQLSREPLQKVKELSQKQDATLFMALTAAFHLLLGWYANQDDVITGTDVANRNLPEIEGMIGFFVNQLVLRTDLSGDPSFAELLQRVRTATLGAFSHQDFPFEKLVEELSPDRTADRNPLFNVKLVLQNTPPLDLRLPGLEVELLRVAPSVAKYLLLLTFAERDGALHGVLEYERNLFEDGTIELLLQLFQEVLQTVVENPDLRTSAIHQQLHALKESHQHRQRTALQSKLRRNLAFTRRKDVSLA